MPLNENQELARPQDWEERPAFREVFLLHAPPLAAEALREASRHLYDALIESDLPETASPWVRARVRAVADDLRVSAMVLASLSTAPDEAMLTHEEHVLALKTETWSDEVMTVVRAMEGALEERRRDGAPLPAGPRGVQAAMTREWYDHVLRDLRAAADRLEAVADRRFGLL